MSFQLQRERLGVWGGSAVADCQGCVYGRLNFLTYTVGPERARLTVGQEVVHSIRDRESSAPGTGRVATRIPQCCQKACS